MNNKPATQKMTAYYSFVQSFYWINFVTVLGFSSVYLLDCGLNNTQIGLVIAIAGVIAALLQPVVASYADKPSAVSLKYIVLISVGIVLVLAVLLFTVYHKSILLTGLFYGGCLAILQFLMPLISSLGTEVINQGKDLNWGVARGSGSVIYAIASYVLGVLVARAGVISIPASIIFGYGMLFLAVFIYPFQKTEKNSEAEKKTEDFMEKADSKGAYRVGPLEFFHKYPRFTIVLAGAVLLYISHVLTNNYIFQIVQSKGGGSSEMGTAMSICAFVEFPTLFLFSWMLKKAGCDVWFRICAVVMALKAVGTLLVPTIPLFYALQLLQFLGWALIAIAPVYYVNAIIKKEDAIKGQAYMAMTYTLGSVLASLMGGPLLDHMGVNAMLTAASAAGVLGAVIICFSTERNVR